ILPHHHLCSRDQHLERLTWLRGEFGSCRAPPHRRCGSNAPKAYEYESTETQEPSHRPPLLRAPAYSDSPTLDTPTHGILSLHDNAPVPLRHEAEPCSLCLGCIGVFTAYLIPHCSSGGHPVTTPSLPSLWRQHGHETEHVIIDKMSTDSTDH